MGQPIPTLIFGSGAFALPVLTCLLDSTLVDVRAVITAPPRPAGRKGELRPSPVAVATQSRGIPTWTPTSLRERAVLEQLGAEAAELIVLADYGRIIPAAVLEMPGYGALNLHPSLLPRHRGASPVPAAILEADDKTGVTLMRMDEGLDTGPILAQLEVALDGSEVAPMLEERLALLGADLLMDRLPSWLDGSLQARTQPGEGATLPRPLRRSDGRLDPRKAAVELERQVRAYQPWPGSWIETGDRRLIVWRASVVAAAAGEAGEIVPHGDSVALLTSADALRLDELQPAGKRRMSGAEYRRGRRQ